MKNLLYAFISACLLATVACNASSEPGWKLVWSEDFDTGTLDPEVWSMTARSTPDWAKTQSHNPRCYEFRDGLLVLRGIVNDDTISDASPYLSGGIWTKNKKSFKPGRFEVRARIHGAQGAWPAIWLMPFDQSKKKWPMCGIINIMEHLHHDTIVYQTAHSYWTYNYGRDSSPKNSVTHPINAGEFNIYGVDMYPDSVVFHVNGERTLCYPKVNDGAHEQFPFYVPQYLIMSMQLGGRWARTVDPADLPAEMEVDWVKFYQYKD